MAIRIARGSELGPSRSAKEGTERRGRTFDKKPATDVDGGITADGGPPDCTECDSAPDSGAGSFYGEPAEDESEPDPKE